jgi:hypothetical protein
MNLSWNYNDTVSWARNSQALRSLWVYLPRSHPRPHQSKRPRTAVLLVAPSTAYFPGPPAGDAFFLHAHCLGQVLSASTRSLYCSAPSEVPVIAYISTMYVSEPNVI